MIQVKVCGMNDPLNVKAIAEAKPDFIGFIFFSGSSRYVGAAPEMALFNNVPLGIKRIGVFLNEVNYKILEISLNTGLDMIQLHGEESPESCFQLQSSGLSIIKSFNIDHSFCFEILKRYLPCCDYFLFDTKSEKRGGSGRKFNWEKLKAYSLDTSVIKSLSNKGFFAVDINSQFEISPGIKDAARVSTFINEIKNDQI